jgi:ACS family tartrate transporter-like MFS transporter
MLLAAVGLATSAFLGATAWSLIAISIAAIGLYAQAVCFFSIPPLVLTAAAAATGFAAINAIGNLGGFLGPYVVGLAARDHGGYAPGLYAMAACALASAALSYLLMRMKWESRAA